MKGIVHFAVGVAAASCFPQAVKAGAAGNPLYFILGGVFGLLPDTVDFKFTRFFFRHDIEVTPDPNKPDAQMIANAVALAVNRACETGKPINIKLDTIRLGADLWQRYEVKFDVPGKRVCASYGPVVNTGGTPVESAAPPKKKVVSAPLICGVKLDYEARTTIDILDGPLFQMAPGKDGRVAVRFIPWHREWSHSFVMALLFALAGTVIWGSLAGLVIACAYSAHIVVDQMGFMGSNLWFPFTRSRTEGSKLVHSGETLPNFATVWFSCLLVFWNLYRTVPWHVSCINPLRLIFYGIIVPAAIYFCSRRLLLARRNELNKKETEYL